MAKYVDQEFVQYLVQSIVDNPNEVKVERTVDEMGVLLTVYVNNDDVGSVVGRQGQTIKSLRLLTKVIGAKNKSRVNIKLIQPDRPDRPARERSDRSDRRSQSDDFDIEI